MCLQKEILNLQKKFNYDIMNSSLARILRVKFFLFFGESAFSTNSRLFFGIKEEQYVKCRRVRNLW